MNLPKVIIILLACILACSCSVNTNREVPDTGNSPGAEKSAPIIDLSVYIGKNYSDVETELERNFGTLTKVYEYSYKSDKNTVIEAEQTYGIVSLYISLGKPDEDIHVSKGLSNVKEFDNQIFYVDNEKLYVIENNKERVYRSFSESRKPLLFDVNGDYYFYCTLSSKYIYKSEIKELSQITTVASDFISRTNSLISVNGHLFYISTDTNLYRITCNGHEKRLLASNNISSKINISSIKYFNGWIYYIDSQLTLKRIKTDGSKTETITDSAIKEYDIDSKGNVVYLTNDNKFFIYSNGIVNTVDNGSLQKRFIDLIPDYEVNILGFENNKLYLLITNYIYSQDEKSFVVEYTMDKDIQEKVIVKDNFSKYIPVVLNGYVYYYNPLSMRFIRINEATLERSEIGQFYQRSTDWEGTPPPSM